MIESMKIFFSQLSEGFKKIPPGKRIVILFTSGLVMVGLLVILSWSQKPQYVPLYTNLTLEDSSGIIEKLKSRQVDYTVVSGGKSILVPSKLVYDLRLELAGDGLPQSGGVGFELFDKTSFGVTEFVQKLNYLRALQGELARTISRMNEVDQARVHIVLPEKSLFKEDQKKTTASVVLKLRSGKVPNKNRVQGIVHLVASAVEGLDPSDVTMVDVNGNILSGGEDSNPISKLTSNQLDYQRNIEKHYADSIETMLESVIGRGKAIARVSAELDFVQEERMEETFDPDSQVARSEKKTEESSTGATPISGIPGVQSNLPDSEAQEQISYKPQQSSILNETRNYEINKVTRKVIKPVGKVKRLSVAVMLDGTYAKGESGDKKEYVPRPESDMKRYEEIVKSTVGFNAERGDIVKVTNVPFEIVDMSEEKEAMESDADKLFYLEMVKYTMSGLGLIVIIIFVIKPIIQWVSSLGTEIVSKEVGGGTMDALEEVMKTVSVEGGEATEDKESVRARVLEIVKQDPKHAAELIRKWMTSRVVRE